MVQDGMGQHVPSNHRAWILQHHSLGLGTVSDALQCTWG